MKNVAPELKVAADTITVRIQHLLVNSPGPILVALDGGSGAGKSTLALMLAEKLDVTLVQSDDFYAAHIPDAGWDARSPQERAADVIDWRRLRTEVLEPLLAGRVARWHPFDFGAGTRPDGTYAMSTAFVERTPASIIVLDGAYSARPELADLIDLSVLVEVPIDVRHQRLAAREEKDFLAAWHTRWDAAEEYYLTQVRPPASFDLIVRVS
jgi:uridine kinase